MRFSRQAGEKKNVIKKILIALSVAALALAGVAIAE